LYVLMTFMGNKADCWPSTQTLCAASALAETTVRRTIKALCEKELLFVVVGGGRKSNRYQVDAETLAGLTSAQSSTTESSRSIQSVEISTPQSNSSGLVDGGDELTKNNQSTLKKRGLNSDHSKAAFQMKSATAAVQTPAPPKPQTASEAWTHVCEILKQHDALYESDKIVGQLSSQERKASRAAGGLPKISSRDRYTATKIRTAFIDAFG